MDESRKEELSAELAQLNRRYSPGKWQGEPYELVQDYDQLGLRLEGNLGEKIKQAREVFLQMQKIADRKEEQRNLREYPSSSEMQLGLANQYTAEHNNRIKDIEKNKNWEALKQETTEQHTEDFNYIWTQVAAAQEQTARANGIDPDNVRTERRLDDRATTLMARAEPPQVLPLWEAAQRREERQEQNTSQDQSDNGKAFLGRLNAVTDRTASSGPEHEQTKKNRDPYTR